MSAPYDFPIVSHGATPAVFCEANRRIESLDRQLELLCVSEDCPSMQNYLGERNQAVAEFSAKFPEMRCY
jgi:hypothetical protein